MMSHFTMYMGALKTTILWEDHQEQRMLMVSAILIGTSLEVAMVLSLLLIRQTQILSTANLNMDGSFDTTENQEKK